MIQPETQEKKKGALASLPKMSTIAMVLVIGLVLAALILLILLNRNLSEDQLKLNGTVLNLQKIASGEQTPQNKYEAELVQVTQEVEAAKAAFPPSSQGPEIMDKLLELADENNTYVTETRVANTTPKGSVMTILTITLVLKGQVSQFENFLLGLGDRLPTCQVKSVAISYLG